MSPSAIRTLVDPADPKDVEQVHALQDAIKVDQTSAGQVRGAELGSGEPEEGARRAARPCDDHARLQEGFGTKAEVDPVRHLIGTAAGWGGNPDKDAIYLNITPAKNDGTTVYKLNVKDVPVDGFWSVSLYNAEGYYEKNPYDAYSLNNITAQEERRRLDRHPVRRLRRQDSELPADHEGLELHGAPLSSARRNPERHMDVPGAAAGAVRDRR